MAYCKRRFGGMFCAANWRTDEDMVKHWAKHSIFRLGPCCGGRALWVLGVMADSMFRKYLKNNVLLTPPPKFFSDA